MKPRIWFLLVALFCAGSLAYALYVQHVLFIDPCPLCVLQRVAFIWIGVWSIVALVHNPLATGRWLYAALIILGCAFGGAVAGRHVWLQSLPSGQVPECGPGLNYMLQTMPFGDAMSQVFRGSGECAEVNWTLLGLSIPWWTLICYIGIGLITFAVVARSRKQRR